MRCHKEFGSRLVDAKPAATKLSVWEKLNGQKLGSLPPHPSPKNMSFQIALVSHSSPFSILCLCRPAPGIVGFLHTVYIHPCALPLGNGSMCRIPYFKGTQEWIIYNFLRRSNYFTRFDVYWLSKTQVNFWRLLTYLVKLKLTVWFCKCFLLPSQKTWTLPLGK